MSFLLWQFGSIVSPCDRLRSAGRRLDIAGLGLGFGSHPRIIFLFSADHRYIFFAKLWWLAPSSNMVVVTCAIVLVVVAPATMPVDVILTIYWFDFPVLLYTM